MPLTFAQIAKSCALFKLLFIRHVCYLSTNALFCIHHSPSLKYGFERFK